jgi:SAM-dependent methyltransferase
MRAVNRDEISARRQALIDRFGPWTAENIDLGHGIYTMAPDLVGMAEERVKRIVQLVSDYARGELSGLRILDLGCYEGGFAVELARRGAEVVALDAREEHAARAQFAKDAIGLDRLAVHHADVRSLRTVADGPFDVVLCLGILYHLGSADAVALVELLFELCADLLILETQTALRGSQTASYGGRTYRGREYPENTSQPGASVVNTTSFWPTRASLLNMLQDAGFSSVCEALNPVIPTLAAYRDHVTFIAKKGQPVAFFGLPTERWPERQLPAGHPAQSRRYAWQDRLLTRRGGGVQTFFVKRRRS